MSERENKECGRARREAKNRRFALMPFAKNGDVFCVNVSGSAHKIMIKHKKFRAHSITTIATVITSQLSIFKM